MGFVCVATWTLAEGREREVLDVLGPLAAASRAEPGCRFYQPHADPADPRTVRIFELYDDRAAFDAHCATPHFRRYVLDTAVPALADRSRAFSDTIGD